MRADLEARLRDRHPHLLRHLHSALDLVPLNRGMETGSGWFGLIDALCHDLEAELVRHPDPGFQLVQVKQKFGALRVYTTPTANPKIAGLIAAAVESSKTVCEDCGATGASLITSGGRMRTTCLRCQKTPSDESAPTSEAATTLNLTPDRVRVLSETSRSSKGAVLLDIGRTISEAYRRPQPDVWTARILRREALGTSGLGRHYALLQDFQHPGEVVDTTNPIFDLWLFLSKIGVEWEALDGQPVHVVVCPVFARGGEHLAYLETLSVIQKGWTRVTADESFALGGMTPAEAAHFINHLPLRLSGVGS